MREAVDLEYILVANEHEALALENNLIKQRKPRFNILLRDDKTYPYVKLTLADRFPKVFVTRRLRKDGAAYYGPYFPGNLAYRIVELIHRSFLIPSCKVDLSRYHPRACLQYYIHRCLGPCVEGLTTPEIYAERRPRRAALPRRPPRRTGAHAHRAHDGRRRSRAVRSRRPPPRPALHRSSAPGKAAHRHRRAETTTPTSSAITTKTARWPSIFSTSAPERSSTAASSSGKICPTCSKPANPDAAEHDPEALGANRIKDSETWETVT
jgi:hypothetical protein